MSYLFVDTGGYEGGWPRGGGGGFDGVIARCILANQPPRHMKFTGRRTQISVPGHTVDLCPEQIIHLAIPPLDSGTQIPPDTAVDI
jgi:hypothetical protein